MNENFTVWLITSDQWNYDVPLMLRSMADKENENSNRSRFRYANAVEIVVGGFESKGWGDHIMTISGTELSVNNMIELMTEFSPIKFEVARTDSDFAKSVQKFMRTRWHLPIR